MNNVLLAATTIACIALSACSEESTTPTPEVTDEEVITHVEVQTIDLVSGDTITYMWTDADGPGGNPPSRIDTIELGSSRDFICSIALYNTSVTPPVSINPAIVAEANNHQFFYTFKNAMATASVTDKDRRGLPLGLQFGIKSEAATGPDEFQVELSHFENVNAKTGTSRSDETDLSIAFPVVIK